MTKFTDETAKRYGLYKHEPGECEYCKEITPYVDIFLMSRVCSIECRSELCKEAAKVILGYE